MREAFEGLVPGADETMLSLQLTAPPTAPPPPPPPVAKGGRATAANGAGAALGGAKRAPPIVTPKCVAACPPSHAPVRCGVVGVVGAPAPHLRMASRAPSSAGIADMAAPLPPSSSRRSNAALALPAGHPTPLSVESHAPPLWHATAPPAARPAIAASYSSSEHEPCCDHEPSS